MFIQGYGDNAMGLWLEPILTTVGGLASALIGNKIAQDQGDSSPEYKNAFNQANESIGKQQTLANQYTGNEGYANSLEQAGIGAGKLANQAVGSAISGARASGMSKAQSAQMGLQSANQNYANAFQGQQGVAQGMGQNAISAQQGITGAYQGQAGQSASEKQAQYNRKKDTFTDITDRAGKLIGTLTGGL